MGYLNSDMGFLLQLLLLFTYYGLIISSEVFVRSMGVAAYHLGRASCPLCSKSTKSTNIQVPKSSKILGYIASMLLESTNQNYSAEHHHAGLVAIT